MIRKLMIALVAILFGSNAGAYTVDNSTLWNTTGLTGYQTSGEMMAGMTVTATFVGGGTQTAIWNASGKAVGADFQLSQNGDTFSNRWTLSSISTSSQAIRSLFIDAGTGNSVFDILSGEFYSPDSYLGTFDISFILFDALAEVVFSGPVAVNTTSYGDLYRSMTINFTNQAGYLGPNGLGFYLDTDSLRYAGDITPNDVPEPGTVMLLAAAFLAIAGLSSRSRRKQISIDKK